MALMRAIFKIVLRFFIFYEGSSLFKHLIIDANSCRFGIKTPTSSVQKHH